MISNGIIDHIKATAALYPDTKSALLPSLDFTQRGNGNVLSKKMIGEVAALFRISSSRAYGVTSYYSMFNTKPIGTWHLQVDIFCQS